MGHGININYNANKLINFYFGASANNNRSTSYSNINIIKIFTYGCYGKVEMKLPEKMGISSA